ncbi:related to dis1-suppressing protein kinase dsk1 [Fusarium torulosum]|uniref:EKC/KEOPS complex subunit BUD32 n=1 Tax=Fusarium torulosum TaxID=33205 RepID=A0AAE8M6L4_9HYPO|nr:related to dis1-suppressing protein kinase dsk1 [Fusarium torulosum]
MTSLSNMDRNLGAALSCSEVSDDFQSPIIASEYPDYKKGDYHPVHLGDRYYNGRYRIVHKIGAGNTSTIWLARDDLESRWVALRILKAECSASIGGNITMCHSFLAQYHLYDPRFITYWHYFRIDGPNGRHLCLVLPFCGPSLRSLSNYMRSRMKLGFVQSLAYQATKMLRDLHRRGLCHGDVRPGNFLVRLRNLDHLDDVGVYRLFGQPKIDRLKTKSGRIPGPEAPRYIVGFLDFMSSGEDVLRDQISLIGFDKAFETSSPWPFDPVFEFLAPEVVIGKPPSPASDVWALGITILNIRSGVSRFPFCIDCPKQLITECVKYFGKLPASWKEPLYDKKGRPTKCTLRGRPRDVSHETCLLKQWIKDIYDEPTRVSYNEAKPSQPFIVTEENGSHPRNYNWIIDTIAGVVNYDPEDIGRLAAIHANDFAAVTSQKMGE